jgi:hypothetical protein
MTWSIDVNHNAAGSPRSRPRGTVDVDQHTSQVFLGEFSGPRMIPCMCATQGEGRLCAYCPRGRKTQCIELMRCRSAARACRRIEDLVSRYEACSEAPRGADSVDSPEDRQSRCSTAPPIGGTAYVRVRTMLRLWVTRSRSRVSACGHPFGGCYGYSGGVPLRLGDPDECNPRGS